MTGRRKTALWYARQAIEHGWSRNILVLQIEGRAHERHGKAITNFAATLPPADSDLAAQVFKDPYLFDFLGTADPRREREVEQALVDHIQRFLLELGTGFAFVGRQVPLEVGDQDFYIDLLFYHLKLRCYVVIELKAVPFDPAFVGQLNLYLSAVDDLLRHPDDKPTIGLLLVPREEQGRRRVRAARPEEADRRRRVGDEARREAPEGAAREPADGGGDRSRSCRRSSWPRSRTCPIRTLLWNCSASCSTTRSKTRSRRYLVQSVLRPNAGRGYSQIPDPGHRDLGQ